MEKGGQGGGRKQRGGRGGGREREDTEEEKEGKWQNREREVVAGDKVEVRGQRTKRHKEERGQCVYILHMQ